MRTIGFGLGLIVLAISVPASLSDDKKKDAPKAAKVVKAGDMVGQIQRMDDDDFIVRVPIKQVDPNKVADAMLWWQRKQIDLMRINNPIQRQQQTAAAMLEFQNRQLNVFKDGYVDISVELAEDLKVRRMTPPEKFDAKGNPAAYTSKELKELRGSDKLAGYEAALADIKQGQYVTVTLVNPPKKGKEQPKEGEDEDTEKKSKKGKKKSNDQVQTVPYLVKVVYIHGEPPS